MAVKKWVVKYKGAEVGLKFPPGARFYEVVALEDATEMGSRVEAMERFERHGLDANIFEVDTKIR